MISNPIYGKIKNVPNHQPDVLLVNRFGIPFIINYLFVKGVKHTPLLIHQPLGKGHLWLMIGEIRLLELSQVNKGIVMNYRAANRCRKTTVFDNNVIDI